MSSDGGSDMAANAWPGFVDILSAVVIMFVFFVLITAAVLYFYTITYKAKIEGQVAQTITEVGQGSQTEKVEKLERENQQLREQIESVDLKVAQGGGSSEVESTNETQAAQSFGAQASEQELIASDDDSSVVLFHDPGAITVDDASKEKIAELIDSMILKHGAENLEIVINSPKMANSATQSRAKRLAVARMLNVRNGLLETAVSRENLQLTVVESEQIGESSDWTRMKINVLP